MLLLMGNDPLGRILLLRADCIGVYNLFDMVNAGFTRQHAENALHRGGINLSL